MEIGEFIGARLDDDKRTAKAAAAYGGAERWRVDIENCIRPNPAPDNGYIACGPGGGGLHDEHAAHIALHDPACVLREVAAKRAIVAEHVPYDCMEPKGQRCHRCASDRAYRSGAAIHEAWPCLTLRHLAAVYSGHPDYCAEWTPEGAA